MSKNICNTTFLIYARSNPIANGSSIYYFRVLKHFGPKKS